MSDDRHDEVAARLRTEAGARAPERLQADVMLRVRAEPRPRRIRRRRTYWRPVGSLAAAACLLGAVVLGVSHVNLSGGGSASGPGTTAALRAAAGDHGGSLGSPKAAAASQVDGIVTSHPRKDLSDIQKQAQNRGLYTAAAERVPLPLWYALRGRLALESPLPKALGTLELHRRHGSH